jgi:hypothetical protein
VKKQVVFGIESLLKDEKIIHNKFKDFLALQNRTTSTAKNQGMLESFLPFRIKHYHWNLNKESGTFISLFPNCDLDGRMFAPAKPNFSWLLQVLFHDHFPGYEKTQSEKYTIDLLNSLGIPYEMIYETDSKNSVKYGDIK